jgi:flagella basal body P-ring formation protein FlgA
MRLLFLIVAMAGALDADCIAVEGTRIYGRDLAAAIPAFSALDSGAPIGFAPLPPMRRVFAARDLMRLAEQHEIRLADVAEVCFVRATQTLSPAQLRPILESAIEIPSATVEVVDFSRYPVPAGKIEFKRASLTVSADSTMPVLWRGRVVHEGGTSSSIWARVRITADRTWVEANTDLPAGRPIIAAQLTARSGQVGYLRIAPIASVPEIVGRKPVRTVAAGKTLVPGMLLEPAEVERGEVVKIAVEAGGAHLALEGTAVTAGQVGQTVMVRNPASGRSFPARVEAKGRVSVAVESKHEEAKTKISDGAGGDASAVIRR